MDSDSRTLSSSLLDLPSLRPRALYPHPIPATYDFRRGHVDPAVCVSLLFFGLGGLDPLDLHLYSTAAALQSAQPVAHVKSVVNTPTVHPDDLAPFGRSWRGPNEHRGAWACNECWSRSLCAFGKELRTYSNRGLRMVLPARRPLFSAAPSEGFR